jgi:hypothetical protein
LRVAGLCILLAAPVALFCALAISRKCALTPNLFEKVL